MVAKARAAGRALKIFHRTARTRRAVMASADGGGGAAAAPAPAAVAAAAAHAAVARPASVSVVPECAEVFKQMKQRRKHKWLVLVINECVQPVA